MTKNRPDITLEMTAAEADIVSVLLSTGFRVEQERINDYCKTNAARIIDRLFKLRMNQ